MNKQQLFNDIKLWIDTHIRSDMITIINLTIEIEQQDKEGNIIPNSKATLVTNKLLNKPEVTL